MWSYSKLVQNSIYVPYHKLYGGINRLLNWYATVLCYLLPSSFSPSLFCCKIQKKQIYHLSGGKNVQVSLFCCKIKNIQTYHPSKRRKKTLRPTNTVKGINFILIVSHFFYIAFWPPPITFLHLSVFHVKLFQKIVVWKKKPSKPHEKKNS